MRWKRQLGESAIVAAFKGTQEIFLAVMATTLTLVAVFVPVAFMGGIVGKFFFQFGLTIAWAVLVSLFVSFTLTPMLAAWWAGNATHGGHGHGLPSNVAQSADALHRRRSTTGSTVSPKRSGA